MNNSEVTLRELFDTIRFESMEELTTFIRCRLTREQAVQEDTPMTQHVMLVDTTTMMSAKLMIIMSQKKTGG